MRAKPHCPIPQRQIIIQVSSVIPMRNISILIPTFNDLCLNQVKALKQQADKIKDLRYEILVADDGSTDTAVVDSNRQINAIENCVLVELDHNVGRAAIRNFLGKKATHERLLFLDCDVSTADDFIERYVNDESEADIVCGGWAVNDDGNHWAGNLRYRYEKSMAQQYSAEKRSERGFRSFRTTNFMIRREVFLDTLFDETIKSYGYEDVLFGKQLSQKRCSIRHIDNAVTLANYEDNIRFVEKTEDSLRTLKSLETDLADFSSLLLAVEKLRRRRLLGVARAGFSVINKKLRNNLCGANPQPWCYRLYKLGYYICL